MLSTYILLPFCIVVSTLKKKLYRVNCMNGLAAHLCSQTIIFAFEFYKCRLQPKMRIPCKLRALTVKWSLSPFKTIHSPVLIFTNILWRSYMIDSMQNVAARVRVLAWPTYQDPVFKIVMHCIIKKTNKKYKKYFVEI